MSQAEQQMALQGTPSGPKRLADNFGRTFTYLRVAVTEFCNLRCIYCLPEEGIPFARQNEQLQTGEFLRIIGVASKLGVDKVRFTGGEPLLHPDIETLIYETSQTEGINTVCLTTNGVRLADRADALVQAGLSAINISLDTLQPEKFLRIARRDHFPEVMAGLEAALKAGFDSIKINVVALKGFNEDEIIAFAELTRNNSLTVRFIELMPFDAHQIWKTGKFLRLDTVEEQLRAAFGELHLDHGSATEAQVYRVPGFTGKFALIPAYTRTICSSCNRIRLTADGKIRNCLFAQTEHDLKSILRSGGSDEEITFQLMNAMAHKARDGWVAQNAPSEGPDRERISMTEIGG